MSQAHHTKKAKTIPELRFPGFEGEWEEKRLGEVAKVDPTTSPLPPEFCYIDLESVDRGQLNGYTRLSKDNAPSRAQRVLEKEDILFQTVRPYQQNNLFFNLDGDFVASTGYAQIRAKQNSQFLYHYLHTQVFLRDVLARCTGSNYPAINSSDLKRIAIWFPSEDEQQKIAGFLTMVEEWIENLKAQKGKWEEYKRGMMQKIFPGGAGQVAVVRFKDEDGNEFPEWEEKRLGEVVTIKTGKKDVNAGSPDGMYPFFTCARGNTFSDEYSFEGEAIMIAGNADVGLCSYYDGKFEAYQRTYVLQDFKLSGSYLFRYLSLYFRQYALGLKQSGAMSYIKLGMLKNFSVPIPSDDEQQKIAAFLTAIDEMINSHRRKIARAEEWKKGLMQRMFV